jgi:glycolate oxidase FAD binding subunit
VDHTITIDSFGPLTVRRPASVAEVCALVKQARAAKQGLYPVGGRTTLDYGLPPTKPGFALDTTALAAVLDYPARDMTVTVQAGITVAALQEVLAREGQWLPVDVALPEKATLGGAVATNASGPRRYGYGTLRDYVIGISFVTDDGVEVKAGGRVVKNVAGYDLMKLQIGALGTLGVITQLTLKVKPKPEASATVGFECDTSALPVILDALAATKTRPVAVELLNYVGNSRGICEGWCVFVLFEEKAAAVAWQVETLRNELEPLPALAVTEFPHASLINLGTVFQLRPESRFIGKLSVPPSKVAEAVIQLPTGAIVHAHALNGVIWVHADAPVPGCEPRRGRAPRPAPSPAWELMRQVKKTLDPDNVFNPGRLLGE